MNQSLTSGRAQLLLSLALLALLVLLILVQGAPTPPRTFDLDSATPNGLLALRLWLTEMGYTVEETIYQEIGNQETRFTLSSDSGLLLIFPTQYPYDVDDAAQLMQWVSAGGTAAIMGTDAYDEPLIERFGVRPGELTLILTQVTQQQPLLPSSPEPLDLTGNHPALDLSNAPNAVAVLADEAGRVTVAVQQVGRGLVWHFSSHHLPVNARLREPAQAALIPPLLRGIPNGSLVQIDTYHLFGPPAAETTIHTLQEWLYYTPWGWAVLFLAGLTALTLVLQGRRLGPPLPSQATVRRREAAEYVIAMGNLWRRAQQRDTVVQHHKRRLKRVLGKRAHISAELDDDAFLRQLAMASSHAGQSDNDTRVSALFQALDQAKDERALIQAVAEIDTLIGTKRT